MDRQHTTGWCEPCATDMVLYGEAFIETTTGRHISPRDMVIVRDNRHTVDKPTEKG